MVELQLARSLLLRLLFELHQLPLHLHLSTQSSNLFTRLRLRSIGPTPSEEQYRRRDVTTVDFSEAVSQRFMHHPQQ